jgi:hypothetical protein
MHDISGFQFSNSDLHETCDDVLSRESHWKRILLTRTHCLNAN